MQDPRIKRFFLNIWRSRFTQKLLSHRVGRHHARAELRGPRCLKIRTLNHGSWEEWCWWRGFDALLRDHPRPDFQSIQYLSRQPPVSQRPILDNSLDNSPRPSSGDSVSRLKLRGSHLPVAGPGYLGWLLGQDLNLH